MQNNSLPNGTVVSASLNTVQLRLMGSLGRYLVTNQICLRNFHLMMVPDEKWGKGE